MSLHAVLVQLQVLLGGSLLQELGAELVNLVAAAAHSVRQHLPAALLLLELQLQALQFVLHSAQCTEETAEKKQPPFRKDMIL